MAVELKPRKVESRLFCMSKFLGDPDMPADMPYPMLDYSIEGKSYQYPLTFVAQIDCSDLASYINPGLLPDEGMLYFFAAIDPYLGFDAPSCGIGPWPKGTTIVKYTRLINPEVFESYESLDEEGEPQTLAPWAIDFNQCDDDLDAIRMLSTSSTNPEDEQIELLRLTSSKDLGLDLGDAKELIFTISKKDLGFCNWKKHSALMK